MAEVVTLRPDAAAQDAMVSMLEDALEKARSGEMQDLAVAAVLKPVNDEPELWAAYWGHSHHAALVASVASLAFDLQIRAHVED